MGYDLNFEVASLITIFGERVRFTGTQNVCFSNEKIHTLCSCVLSEFRRKLCKAIDDFRHGFVLVP